MLEEIIILITGLIIGIVITYLILRERLKNEFEKWKLKETESIRNMTKEKMRNSIKGLIGE